MIKPDPSLFDESTEDLDLEDMIEISELPRDLLHASALSRQLRDPASVPPPCFEADFDAEPSLTGANLSWQNGQVVTRVSFRARWRRFVGWLRRRRDGLGARARQLLVRIPTRRRARARMRMLTPKP